MSKPNWEVNESSATLTAKNWMAKLDVSNPSTGLALSVGDKSIATHLFSFLLNDKPIDMFVRDTDLVLRYPPRNSDLVSYETYFRIAENAQGLELILSAQTHLLQSKPETKVTATFASMSIAAKTAMADQIHELDSDANFGPEETIQYFLIRPHNSSELSILLMSHPSDFHRAAVQSGQVAFWVFPHSLEKGVIRRARFQMRLLERATDEIEAARIFAGVEQESPPLAT